ncbi:hypothetical protein AADG42_14950 [Ammonicoccus fulvus]|uniref:ABC transmembrane type-1 domain-containing protein n=1 Tax=Ammonicoccus fulvus TaxID=3138240 RepID=A0ABZ3FV30_9ACTN
MRTVREFTLLAGETLALWVRAFPRLGFWFCVGYLIRTAGLLISLAIGPSNLLLSTLAFIVGEVGFIAGLLLMLHSARGELWSPQRLAGAERAGVPATVFDRDSATTTLLLALGPFLAVYSVWGMVEDRVAALFHGNVQAFGLDAAAWSVSFSYWPLYAAIAGVALALRLLLSKALGQRDGWWQAPVLLLEGIWVFASFFVLTHLGRQGLEWLTTRAFWVGAENAWYAFADTLPDIALIGPFAGWTMPQLAQESWGWFWSTFLPGLSMTLFLPLVWLALTAVVHGWREFRAADVLSGTPAARVTGRTLPRWAEWATDDLRHKYLPVISALRLILAAGPRFLGAYLVLATLLRVGQEWLNWALAMVVGELPINQAVAYGYVRDFLSAFLGMTLLAALYLAAFDRGIAETTKLPWREPRRARRAVSAGSA